MTATMDFSLNSAPTILLVNASDRSTWPNLLSRVLGMNGLFALAQWLAFLVFGKLLIGRLGGTGYCTIRDRFDLPRPASPRR